MSKNLLRAAEAAEYLGIAESTLWRWTSNGKLPKPYRLSPRCTGWKIADLDAFVESTRESKQEKDTIINLTESDVFSLPIEEKNKLKKVDLI